MLNKQNNSFTQVMLLFTVLSVLALPSALGGLLPRQSEIDQLGCDASTAPIGEKRFVMSFEGTSVPWPSLTIAGDFCNAGKIDDGSSDMDDQACVKQPSTKSIMVPPKDGGSYCLQLYGDFNCRTLETSKEVDVVWNGGGECVRLGDTIFASYRWVRKCSGEVSPWNVMGRSELTNSVPGVLGKSEDV